MTRTYVVVEVEGGFAIQRLALQYDVRLPGVFQHREDAEVIRDVLLQQTTDIAVDARNECLLDIRRTIFDTLHDTPLLTGCEKPEDVAITITLDRVKALFRPVETAQSESSVTATYPDFPF